MRKYELELIEGKFSKNQSENRKITKRKNRIGNKEIKKKARQKKDAGRKKRRKISKKEEK